MVLVFKWGYWVEEVIVWLEKVCLFDVCIWVCLLSFFLLYGLRVVVGLVLKKVILEFFEVYNSGKL